MNTLVDVLNELNDGSTIDLVGRIVGETGSTFTVRYLSPTKKFYGERVIYKYENETYEIDKLCVSGYYDSTEEEDAGFEKIEGGWVQIESESDYQPSDEPETETESDESVVESEED